MKKAIIKLLLFLSPVFILLAIYLYTDPFKVVHHYDPYWRPTDTFYIDANIDYYSTQNLIQNYPKNKYDSYIFGSSRSGNFPVKEWGKHINSKAYYHFYAGYETLYGIDRKMQFIKHNDYQLNNALIVIDGFLLANIKNMETPLFIKHPALSGQSRYAFQSVFLKGFFDKDFLIPYLHLIFSGDKYKYANSDPRLTCQEFRYDAFSNEVYPPANPVIETDSDKYYRERAKLFYERDTVLHYGQPVIGAQQKEMLLDMKNIMDEKHTAYRIIISPNYDQVKLDSNDLKTLQDIFGKQYVFDFSGINEITRSIHNYYEPNHYRHRVAVDLMNAVYQ